MLSRLSAKFGRKDAVLGASLEMKKPAFAGLSPQGQSGQATIYYGSVVDRIILALIPSVK